MKSKRGLSALTLLGVFILCLSFVSADFVDNGGSAQNVTDCGILNTTDGVYTLNQSLSSSFDCITINATGIVLDCAFYNITFGNETGGLGIMVSGDGGETSLNNVTVENCYVIQNISGSNESAIFFGPGSENAIVYNNIIETYGNETRGIIIGDNSINANVSLNLVYTNSSGATGIEIADNGFNATIKDNVVLTLGNDASGIFLMDNVSDVNIYNNTLWQMGNRTLSNAMGGIVLEQNTHDLNVSFNIIISGYASGLSIGDDYILEDENWTLDGGGYNASGIWIWGTNLTADNNIMISFGDLGKGIFMNNVEGVNLMSNIIVTVGEGGHGILSEMSETSPLTFYNNLIGTFGENASGIYLNQDGYDNISSNEIYTYGNYSYGIFFVQSHNTTVFGNEIVTDVPTSHVLYLNTSGEELIYNNLFNTSTNDSGVYIINSNPSDFNITKTSGTNIVGKSFLGGNYWANNNGTGYSDSCTESTGDYICDSSYEVSGSDFVDYLPLTLSTSYVETPAGDTGSPGGGGSGTASFWINTFVASDEQFVSGFSREYSARQRAKVTIGTESHYVGVISLTSSAVTINVSSTPQQAVFNVGDTKKFEVNNDSYYDISIKLNSINNAKANITILSLHEEVPVSTTANSWSEDETDDEPSLSAEGDILAGAAEKSWLIPIIVVIILAGVIALVIVLKKKKILN